MTFNSLTIQKRTDSCCEDRYNNVCLVLDGDVRNQYCTDTDWGFYGAETGNNIIWEKKKQGQGFFRSSCSDGTRAAPNVKYDTFAIDSY